MPHIKKQLRAKLIKITLLLLAVICIVLVIFWLFGAFSKKTVKEEAEITIAETKKEAEEIKIEHGKVNEFLDKSIDSVLNLYGIKKEWISTTYASDTSKKTKTKKEQIKFQWFSKTIQTPKDVNGIELNSEITNLIRLASLDVSVEEDIKTKNFVMAVSDTSKQGLPLAIISIIFSDKAVRDDGIIVVLLKLSKDYSKHEIEYISANMPELSLLITSQLEDTELIMNLKHLESDIIYGALYGDKANFGADFRSGMTQKEIKNKVKSLRSDYPSAKTVLLMREFSEPVDSNTFNQITAEYKNLQIKILTENILTPLTSEETKDNNTLITTIRTKLKHQKKIIFIAELPFERLKSFYTSCDALRKLGYKFYTLNEYLEKEEMLKKKEIEEQQKKEQEKTELKKKEIKKQTQEKPKPTKKTEEKKKN